MNLAQDTAGAELDGLAGWAVNLMETLGGPGAALIVGLDNLFPPIPSELVLPLAGFTASQGTMSLPGALFWTTLGSVVGAVITYLVGAALGPERTRALVTRIPLFKVSDFDRTEAWFVRHGAKAVFFGRMIPIFRSLISVPAGIQRMPMVSFIALTTAGSLIWNTIFVLAGYQLGENWHLVEDYAGIFQRVVIVAVAAAVIFFVVTRVRAARRAGEPEGERPGEERDAPTGRFAEVEAPTDQLPRIVGPPVRPRPAPPSPDPGAGDTRPRRFSPAPGQRGHGGTGPVAGRAPGPLPRPPRRTHPPRNQPGPPPPPGAG
ncbi:membrane protein DedA, SNARE-associated domain [Actinoalloteichus cyanogriseus DSM 43889]|uniref:Membrane protein DedA, SNARE-associated domain n=1 Tax=Actinoalloteichus caeruleus DSM 43889 TaxID=1120930 RepID=A0ABT1JLF9_ACTCY|nr:membrane protein DedA, SNARE-associated domain [Actinoalloteichus caeruleus DSM 43889]